MTTESHNPSPHTEAVRYLQDNGIIIGPDDYRSPMAVAEAHRQLTDPNLVMAGADVDVEFVSDNSSPEPQA